MERGYTGQITMIRQAILFTFAAGLLIGGLYLIYLEVFVTRVIMGKMIGMGALLVTLGCAWLWADFIGPLLGLSSE